jgi:hypothetical protein
LPDFCYMGRMMPTRLAGFSTRSALSLLALLLAARSAAGVDSPSGAPPGPSPPSAAIAKPTPDQLQAARELFAAASKEEEGSHWAEALNKLQRVAEVKLTAGVRYHIALCEERLGRIASAFASYTAAREAAEREHNKDVLDLLEDPFLLNLRARIPTLAIEIPPGTTGAIVTIDGRPYPLGASGAVVRIDPGPHRIEASAPGRGSFSKELTVRERDVTMLDVVLPSASISPFRPAPSLSPSPSPSSSAMAPATAPSFLLPTLTTTGAVAFVGGGVAAYFLAASAQTTGQAECLVRTSCDDLKTPVRTWDAVALGAWIGGAALATTSVILWLRPNKSAAEASSARVTVGAAQFRVEGSF